jgi:hypothetical protein
LAPFGGGGAGGGGYVVKTWSRGGAPFSRLRARLQGSAAAMLKFMRKAKELVVQGGEDGA